jgi:hypothetical protein
MVDLLVTKHQDSMVVVVDLEVADHLVRVAVVAQVLLSLQMVLQVQMAQ